MAKKKSSKKATNKNTPSLLGMVAAIAKDKVKKVFAKKEPEVAAPTGSVQESAAPDEVVAKAANVDEHTTGDNATSDDEENANAAPPDTPAAIADPLTSFDKHAYEKATTKGDPHGKIHLNTQNKSSIRPFGKKAIVAEVIRTIPLHICEYSTCHLPTG
ncbi:MAG: hypothetical protein WDM90_17280 [Ferruginibacter sp.]